MFSDHDLIPPRLISSKLFNKQLKVLDLDETDRNLAIVQWTQFVEHDLSKAVVSSMSRL